MSSLKQVIFRVHSSFSPPSHFDEHPVARREVEVVRPLNDEPCDVGGKHDPRGDDAPTSVVGEHGREPVQQAAGEHDHWGDDPVPGGLGVECQYGEVGKVQQVREVEHLFVVETVTDQMCN